MLFSFFLKRFLLQFIMVFVVIILVLGACNLVLRIEFFSNFFAMIHVFFVMLPLMAIYAMPLAAIFSIQKVIGDLLVEDELLVINYFKLARRTLITATMVSSLLWSFFYAILIFEVAPQSYLQGKKILLSLAKQQFCHLESQKFHSPYPGLTFFFKEKRNEHGEPHFFDLFLAFHSKNERYIFTAKQGYFQQNKILMLDGSVHTISSDKRYAAMFKETTINLDKILKLEKTDSNLNVLKFWNITQLLAVLKKSGDAMFEILKRLAQLLWMFLFPLLGLALIFRLGRKKSNMLISVLTSGLLFLISYISIAMSQAVSHSVLFSAVFLYFPLFICSIFCIKSFILE